MPVNIDTQSLDDIFALIERAQQQGRRLKVSGERVELSSHGLGRWIFRRADQPATEVASKAVAQAIRRAILSRLDQETSGSANGASPASRRALRQAVMQLHQGCGPNELPVARYRALLAEFKAAATRADPAASAGRIASPAEPRLNFDAQDPAGVEALLDQVGPGANTLRGLLADYEHELAHRLFPPAGADRPQACARLMDTLSRLMDRLDKLASPDAEPASQDRADALNALKAGVETEVKLMAHALTVEDRAPDHVTWRTALAAARQDLLGAAHVPETAGSGSRLPLSPAQQARAAMEDALAVQARTRAAQGAGPLGAAGDEGGSHPVGDPSGTPWGDMIEAACRHGRKQAGSAETASLQPEQVHPASFAEGAGSVTTGLGAQLQAAEAGLRSFASAECRRLCQACDDGDPERIASLVARVDALVEDVVSTHLHAPELLLAASASTGTDAKEAKTLGYRTQRALLEAQHDLRAGLQALHLEWLGDDGVVQQPQVTVFTDGPMGPPRYVLVQPAPAVENLVLGGGGMKSTGISAALTAYAQAGLLSDVKKIAGSSAGAITGGILACGWPLDDVARINAELSNFNTVFHPLDGGHQLATLYPGLSLASNALSHAGRLVRAMDFQTATAVQAWLKDHEDDLRRAMRSRMVSMAEVQHLDRLRRQNLSGVNREPQMVTFRDLEVLHRIAPDRFKLLAMTAYDAKDQTGHTFDVTTHPDLPIAYAARASMAAPVAFTAANIEGRRYLDGGLYSNVPVDLIHGGQHGAALDRSRASTLLLAYESLGETNQSLHLPMQDHTPSQPVADLMFRLLGQAGHSEAEHADRRRIRDTGPQTAVVYHGDLNTFDFGAEPERVAFAVAHSRLMAQEQVAQRKHQAYHTVYERPQDVVQALDAPGRRQLVQQLQRLETATQGLEDPLINARHALLHALS